MLNQLNQLFDFIIPRFCPGCNKKLLADEMQICHDCLNSILAADSNRLEREFQRKFSDQKIISKFYAQYVFEADKTLQNIIHVFKYQKQFNIGEFLGKIIGEEIKKLNWQADIIIPVPIHHLKKAERGYNQSDYIAKGISKVIKIPYSSNSISRKRYTESQTGLLLNDRAENVANAFKVRNSKRINGNTVLLVDDVITTGATTSECAKELIKSGAKSIYACSIGIAE